MYTAHFGLDAEPFRAAPDPSFIYLGPENREALVTLRHALMHGRGFVSLVGELGVGKTTLVQTLVAELRAGDLHVAYVVGTGQRLEGLLAAAVQDLGLDGIDSARAGIAEVFEAHLRASAANSRPTVLLVDEAQSLAGSTLLELAKLGDEDGPSQGLLRLVLIGQPELAERLELPTLRPVREHVAVHAVLHPLSPTELERYIEHRLRRVGRSTRQVFTPRAVKLIVEHAGGNPLRTNLLCTAALQLTAQQREARVTSALAYHAMAELGTPQTGWRVVWHRVRDLPLAMRGGAPVVAAAVAFLIYDSTSPTTTERPAMKASDQQGPPAPVPRAAPPPPEVKTRPLPDAGASPKLPTLPPPREAKPQVHPATLPPAVVQPEGRTVSVTVPPGTTLWTLARGVYGEEWHGPRVQELLAEIRRLNPQLSDITQIRAGDVLKMPAPRAAN